MEMGDKHRVAAESLERRVGLELFQHLYLAQAVAQAVGGGAAAVHPVVSEWLGYVRLGEAVENPRPKIEILPHGDGGVETADGVEAGAPDHHR